MPATAANYTWGRDVSNGMFLNAYCLTLVLCRIWLYGVKSGGLAAAPPGLRAAPPAPSSAGRLTP